MHQFAVALGALRARHTLEVGVEVQILLDGEVLVQTEALRHVAQGGLHRQGIQCGIQVQHMDAAGIGHQQAGGQAHQGGLAGPVRADQPGHPPRLDGEAHPVECLDGAPARSEGQGQVAGFQHRTHFASLQGSEPVAGSIWSRRMATLAGMPRRNCSWPSHTKMRAWYTRLARTSVVSTAFGVNSALGET